MVIDYELISVIVPVYSRDYCLNQCLDSIKKQSYTHWECIVVDDGSKDKSLDIMLDYQQKDARFKVITQLNRGVSSARNEGLKMAKGAYVAFVDSDDYVHADYLLNLYTGIGDCDWCISGILQDDTLRSYPSKTIYPDARYEEDFAGLENVFLLNGPVGKLYRMDIIHRELIFFMEDHTYGEDTIFNFSYLYHVNSIRIISDCLYFVNETVDSLSHRTLWLIGERFISLWEVRNAYYQSKQLIGPMLEPILSSQYCFYYTVDLYNVCVFKRKTSFCYRYKYLCEILKHLDRNKLEKARGIPKRMYFLLKHPFFAAFMIEYKRLFLTMRAFCGVSK